MPKAGKGGNKGTGFSVAGETAFSWGTVPAGTSVGLNPNLATVLKTPAYIQRMSYTDLERERKLANTNLRNILKSRQNAYGQEARSLSESARALSEYVSELDNVIRNRRP